MFIPFRIRVHYDNGLSLDAPNLCVWYAGSSLPPQQLAEIGKDNFGPFYDLPASRPDFTFKFKEGSGLTGRWESQDRDRAFTSFVNSDQPGLLDEIWCKADKAFVYPVEPQVPEQITAPQFLKQLTFNPGSYVPGTGSLSGLGASFLADGRVLFGYYQPNAAKVYLVGNFNQWQRPGVPQSDPAQFIEMKLYRGYFNQPNTWLTIVDGIKQGDEYGFFVLGGVPTNGQHQLERSVTDPYARQLGPNFHDDNAVVIDPRFNWQDADWHTPAVNQLILYELSVYGFTENDMDITPAKRGRLAGITERVEANYFNNLGVNTLSLMPLPEVPTMQGPTSLGYDPSLYFALERDFGNPNDLRQFVNAAHRHGLAVLLDQVFNHTSNRFNPLWKMILEHPDEEYNDAEGGLYFNGSTPWGNRIDTWKEDVQNMLIDACKMYLAEYHVDGFRFDATYHDVWISYGFLERLARELKEYKPDVILVAENLPNQSDLNGQGYDGYAQWCNLFHDKIKALTKEGSFEGCTYDTVDLGSIFYFNKDIYAAHTNNVVNYSESHDERSVSQEVKENPALNHPAAIERKGRLGLFAVMTALGQPMLYMGQEFNVERDRNFVSFAWPDDLTNHGFFQWATRLIHLRQRYPGLKLYGYNPAETGQFSWILAPWLEPRHGGGHKVIGWRAKPNQFAHDTLVVMLNFENYDVTVDLDFGLPGIWLKLADIDRVNDIPPVGSNSVTNPTAVSTSDGQFSGFTLPGSSAFIYKWEAAIN